MGLDRRQTGSRGGTVRPCWPKPGPAERSLGRGWDSLGQTLYDQDRDAEIEAWVAAGGCPAVADRGRELMEAHP
jgi:hypothetical protein